MRRGRKQINLCDGELQTCGLCSVFGENEKPSDRGFDSPVPRIGSVRCFVCWRFPVSLPINVANERVNVRHQAAHSLK